MLVLSGGHIHARIGTPMTSAGTRNASHSRRRAKSDQKAPRTTTVPYACTWKIGNVPAMRPTTRKGLAPSFSRVATHSTTSRMRARLKPNSVRSEEHTSELQSPCNLVCRLLLEKKNQQQPTS